MQLLPPAHVCSFWIGGPAEAWNGPALGSGDRCISFRYKKEVAERKHFLQTLFLLEQLGHDGLAGEAGFPQGDNVEVYDAWYGLPQVPQGVISYVPVK